MEEKIKCPFCGSENVSVWDGTNECECADCKRGFSADNPAIKALAEARAHSKICKENKCTDVTLNRVEELIEKFLNIHPYGNSVDLAKFMYERAMDDAYYKFSSENE